ncbi:MAG: hypothetical protein ACR2IH_08735 [Pyrinomonadaceae bacterium]
MAIEQRVPNPDVNSFDIDEIDPGDGSGDAGNATEDMPLQPDRPAISVEEPPGRNRPPSGDVDESPKRIA